MIWPEIGTALLPLGCPALPRRDPQQPETKQSSEKKPPRIFLMQKSLVENAGIKYWGWRYLGCVSPFAGCGATSPAARGVPRLSWPWPQLATPVAAPAGLRHIPSAGAVQAPGAADPQQRDRSCGTPGADLQRVPPVGHRPAEPGGSSPNRTNPCKRREAANSLLRALLGLGSGLPGLGAPCLPWHRGVLRSGRHPHAANPPRSHQRWCALLRATP